MARTQCNHCSASAPAAARFCPRCGHAVDITDARPVAGQRRLAPGAHPSTAPMPLAGICFLVASVLGPTMIAVGVSTGTPILLLAGVVIAIVLIGVLLLGMVC